MSDAQAIPDNLFSYSDQATGANTDLQQWITSVLTPAVQLYQETAIDLGNNIDDLTSPNTGTIDSGTRSALSSIWDTDKQVRAAGQAFLDAGDQGQGTLTLPAWLHNHPDPGGDPNQYAIVTTPDGVIDDEMYSREGSALAAYYEQHGPTSYVFQQLALYQNDPAYMAAFFNGLTPAQVESLLETWGDWRAPNQPPGPDQSGLLAQALASAYASGQLSPAIEKQIAQWLTLMPANRFRPLFCAALAKDPQAALNFISSLTPQEFSKLAAGSFGEPWQAEFIEVCAAAIDACPDSKSAYDLFTKITTAVTSGETWNPYQNDGQAIADLVSAAAAKKISNPSPGASQTDLESWAAGLAGAVKELMQPWVGWIKNQEGSDQQTNATAHQVVSKIVSALMGTISAPEGVAAGAWGWLTGQAGSQFTDDICNHITEPTEDPTKSNDALINAVRLLSERLAVAKLLAEGAIYPKAPGKEGSQPLPATPANVEAIVNAFNAGGDPGKQTQYSVRIPGQHDMATFWFLSGVKTEIDKEFNS